jgi:hypothetical protein
VPFLPLNELQRSASPPARPGPQGQPQPQPQGAR